MDPTRLRLGEIVAGAAAAALLVTLFFDWNRDRGDDAVAGNAAGFGTETAWSSLGWPMLLLLLVAIGLAVALVVTTAGKRPAAIPIGAAVLTTAAGIVVAVALAVRIVFLDDSLAGAYVGLLFAALIPVGGWLAMADERTQAPYSAVPDLPRRPAPPAEA